MSHTKFKVTYWRSPKAGRLGLLTMDNELEPQKPNTFGQEAIGSLSSALDEIEAEPDLKGLMLIGKPFVFAVGADVDQFLGADAEFAREAGERGHQAFRRLKDLPFPTLAAVNGAAMGGGMEIALHCDYRTISDFARPLAFPEVFLSIIPAWGGTQLAPRVMGAENALKLIVHNALDNNRTIKAKQALDLGFADRMYPNVDFVERSRELLEAIVAGEETIERPDRSGEDVDGALRNARNYADGRVHGGTDAPYRAIELIEFAAGGGDLDEGYQREEDALAELLPARQAQSAVYAFRLTQQRIKRQPWRPDAEPRAVKKVGVVGAGLMGRQLGSFFLERLEVPIVMKDIDQDVVDQARQHIEGEIDDRAAKGRIGDGKANFLKSLVSYTTQYDELEGADFVIEAVVEELDLKKRIWADVEEVVDEGAVLASNTSSLSITEQAADLEHPERVIGFHFFNPVRVLPLLEIVQAERSSDAALATGFEVSKKLKKSGILCADTPAFIANRLLMKFNQTAMGALQHGNDFQGIDQAIQEVGIPMGPFQLFGFVGIKVAHHTAQTLHDAWPDRFPMDPNLARIAELDVDGIYDWSQGGRVHEEIRDLVVVDDDAEPLSGDEIRDRALRATAEEAKVMLDEGTVADARDIDTALLLGAGWPFFVGGICKYADETGLSQELFGEELIADQDRAAT